MRAKADLTAVRVDGLLREGAGALEPAEVLRAGMAARLDRAEASRAKAVARDWREPPEAQARPERRLDQAAPGAGEPAAPAPERVERLEHRAAVLLRTPRRRSLQPC
jgi:hypothetical protein